MAKTKLTKMCLAGDFEKLTKVHITKDTKSKVWGLWISYSCTSLPDVSAAFDFCTRMNAKQDA